MKQYPSITTNIKPVYGWVFDKIDGSNIRAEWSTKQGFYKFGTRKRLLQETDPVLGEAVKLIREKQDQLGQIFSEQKWDRVVAYFEFYGENSFAGAHQDEEHFVTLIDVDVYKIGILPPQQFIELFKKVGIPKILFEGKIDSQLITDIKQGNIPEMTFEGAVVKYFEYRLTRMFKVKNKAWINKLREKCGNNVLLFKRLA